MQRPVRGQGIAVDPERVRTARLAAGLSLAALAGKDVSRTMIHFIEHGKSRPSQRVLELIASRTGKPLSYFKVTQAPGAEASGALSAELGRIAKMARTFGAGSELSSAERDSMRLVELTLQVASQLVEGVETRVRRRPTRVPGARRSLKPAR